MTFSGKSVDIYQLIFELGLVDHSMTSTEKAQFDSDVEQAVIRERSEIQHMTSEGVRIHDRVQFAAGMVGRRKVDERLDGSVVSIDEDIATINCDEFIFQEDGEGFEDYLVQMPTTELEVIWRGWPAQSYEDS